jgi:hypothetical protein
MPSHVAKLLSRDRVLAVEDRDPHQEPSFRLSRGSTERLLRRPGLVDKAPARIVVGGVGAEEALEALHKLLAAVCLEWFEALVVCASAPFVLEARAMQSIACESLRECAHASLEVVDARAQDPAE